MYPMAPQEFEKWLAILRGHFHDNSVPADVGAKWYPAKSPPPRAGRYRPHGLLPACPSSAHDVYSTCLAVHIRVGLLKHFFELTVFDARLYIRVRRVDQPA
jgi:hypothetical protein